MKTTGSTDSLYHLLTFTNLLTLINTSLFFCSSLDLLFPSGFTFLYCFWFLQNSKSPLGQVRLNPSMNGTSCNCLRIAGVVWPWPAFQLRKNAGGARSKSANLALSCQPEGFVRNWDIDLKSIRIANGVPCHRHRTIVTFKKRDERGLILNEPARWHQIHDVELHYNDISALLNKTSLIQRLTVFIEGKGRQVAFFRPPSILKHFMIKMTGRSGLTEPKSVTPAGQMSRVGGMTSISILITLSLENPASVFRIRPVRQHPPECNDVCAIELHWPSR